MPTVGVLECAVCQRRYSLEAVAKRLYFPVTLVCGQCYHSMQRKPHHVCCFGKPTVNLPSGARKLGFDPECEECQWVCPDRAVCRLIMKKDSAGLKTLDYLSMRWLNRVVKAVAHVEKLPVENVRLYPRDRDRVKLLILRAWCLHYRVSLEFVLRTLFEYFSKARARSKRRRSRRRVFGVGITISALTSLRAREILETRIYQEYPCDENYGMARTALRMRLLEQRGVVKARTQRDPKKFVALYRRKISARKKALRYGEERFQRAWRGNPWR